MISILLVEDEAEKKRQIVEAALEVPQVTLDCVHVVADVYSAKLALQARKYDLLILDINIPGRSDRITEVGRGLDVLHFIQRNATAIAPTYIVGMTAYDDALAAAASDFASPLWKLVKFSYSELSWKEPLKQAIVYLVQHNQPPYPSDGRTYHTDLGIIVALEAEELDSIRQLNADWQCVRVPYDDSRYFRGRFTSGASSLDVVAVASPRMGMPPAAVVATKLIQAFRPRYLAMTGICAGVRRKTKVGDILVADPCFDWGSGKWVKLENEQIIRFRPAPYPWRLDEALRSGITRCAESPGLLKSIYDSFSGKKSKSQPRVIVEAMASGGSVLQTSQLMSDVQEQHKNLVGVEMESYAVFTAAQYCTDPKPTCFSIKSVCDFGDDKKTNHFHKYAAHNSAQFLYHFVLSELNSTNPISASGE